MPCWSGSVKVVEKRVEFGVVWVGMRGRRWKGESMVNSSWRLSWAGRVRGERCVVVYSESSIVNVWGVRFSFRSSKMRNGRTVEDVPRHF